MDRGHLTPESTYRRRCAEFAAQRDRYQRRSDRNGNLSVLLFVLGVAAFVAALWQGGTPLAAAAIAIGLGFIISLVIHDRTRHLLRRYRELYALNDQALHRLRREWSEVPAPAQAGGHPAGAAVATMAPTETPSGADRGPRRTASSDGATGWALDAYTAADLDLLGRASLEHLLGTANTPAGQATVRDWILRPAPPAVVAERQAAAAELAPKIDLRDEVCLRGRLMGPTQTGYERFVAWSERPGLFHKRPWLPWLARLLTAATLGLAIAQLASAAALPGLIAVLIADAAVSLGWGRAVAGEIDEAAAREDVFRTYADIFSLITGQSFASSGLQSLQARLSAGGLSADRQMRRLGRLMPLADIRRWMFFFPIDLVTLWSFHVLWLFDRWRRSVGGSVRTWLEALGEAEALIALATLHHDQPDWAFPELVETAGDEARIEAAGLAHPLLPPDRAVGNDVRVGPPGTYLLVTGSNMSGKSTLLRAIGANAVLAQMGAPVAAAHLRLPPLAVASSMRVQDSLQQGVSSYMAELRRLKTIVDLADALREAPGLQVLYLLDEILQGTNTYERQIAARRIVLHLVKSGAIGAISTHDLTLADSPAMAAASLPVYLTESFSRGPEGPTMSFDYRLRPGIATSTNALKLMELIGLPLEDG